MADLYTCTCVAGYTGVDIAPGMVAEARARCADALDRLPAEHRSLVGSTSYPVHIDQSLQAARKRLLARTDVVATVTVDPSRGRTARGRVQLQG